MARVWILTILCGMCCLNVFNQITYALFSLQFVDVNAIVRAILHTSTLQPRLSPQSLAVTQETQTFDNVKRLFFLYLRKRDKEMMVDLLFQVDTR